MYLFLVSVGVLCLFYFISIGLFIGHGNHFYFLWLFLGLAFIGFAIVWKKGIWEAYLSLWLRRVFAVGVCSLTALFLIVEGCIISGFLETAPQGLDYLVVLGAQIKSEGPSRALQYRLDAAAEYLQENPDTIVIVSGGQGADEPISEAQGMHDYLLKQGVDAERIRLESESVDTFQNLTFSAKYLDKEKDSVGIVSNNFHIFRAVGIAKKAGYERVYGIAAKSEPYSQCNNMMREFFGVMRDWLVGNM